MQLGKPTTEDIAMHKESNVDDICGWCFDDVCRAAKLMNKAVLYIPEERAYRFIPYVRPS
jgi:hypothetical protein